jgi:V/A-type H+-transporting ATPase subunit D
MRAREAAAEFAAAAQQGALWGRRSMLVGGTAEVEHGAASISAMSPEGEAQIELPWKNTMGVIFPDEPRCSIPMLSPLAAAASNPAIAVAAAAFRRTLEAAARTGAAEAARRIMQRELAETERRLRAIERHRIPSLEAELANLELRLDELEREERVVTRWARQRRDSTDTSVPPAPSKRASHDKTGLRS